MSMDDNDGQMIFGDRGVLKLPDICLTSEEKPRKNLTQETYTDRGSNPGPLRDKRACYHLLHSGGLFMACHGDTFTFTLYKTLQFLGLLIATPTRSHGVVHCPLVVWLQEVGTTLLEEKSVLAFLA